ncbi:hypothetical protein [Sphingomonas hankyongi]|uniref:Uncharacterized protein n=1 Tax=Sphingomonas hankyongi TaxID=2908209 RepID=A0ABT0S0U9_9SPHN|nr:hypothetical protein [Sphingomonas hankyongi]MCL6729472.1 hypothetical protein [Sphingomonas hankyongi]
MKAALWAALAAFMSVPALAGPATPLFSADTPIRITIKGPITALTSNRSNAQRAGTLTVTGTQESYPIMLSVRGITRRQGDVCQFPPLRVDFPQHPAAGSLFAGQRRLKLVTHCRRNEDFQQKVLLEYAAYRLYNLMTPLSFRARLANIDYVDEDGRPYISRIGFFVEDGDDMAKRNDLHEPKLGDRVSVSQLEPRGAARFALFNYMIGNLDWSMRAGPAGESCCHNGRLLSANKAGSGVLVPVPYDFDFSGLVDAPYATPPDAIPVGSVRQRVYRGYCAHFNEARAVGADLSARRSELLGLLSTIPGMTERTRANAADYLGGFFRDLDSGKALKNCVN